MRALFDPPSNAGPLFVRPKNRDLLPVSAGGLMFTFELEPQVAPRGRARLDARHRAQLRRVDADQVRVRMAPVEEEASERESIHVTVGTLRIPKRLDVHVVREGWGRPASGTQANANDEQRGFRSNHHTH